MLSIEEAILIGEAATLNEHITPILLSSDTIIPRENVSDVRKVSMMVVERLEKALLLNPSSFYSLYFLFLAYNYSRLFLTRQKVNDLLESQATTIDSFIILSESKIIDYSFKLLDDSAIPEGYDFIRGECHYMLESIFSKYPNIPAAHKHAKLAYEHCIRSRDDKKHGRSQGFIPSNARSIR